MTELVEVKPFFEYHELVQRLMDRGMTIDDPLRAQRKLTQVGYYRLSGYWYTSRKFERDGKKIKYENAFQPHTNFESIFKFYLFDKQLRLEFTNALERIEIFLRTIIAHEIGRIDPLAYLDKKQFSKASFKAESTIRYDNWLSRHNKLIQESKEDSIKDHLSRGKPIPIWVAAEAWDFGSLSKFYSILSGNNQDLICARLGIDNRNVLDNWFINLNGIRNRCAHHARLCNRPNPRTLSIPQKGYFNLLQLKENERNKFYGLVAIIWFLLKQLGHSSNWISRIADLIDKKPQIPGFSYASMGFPTTGFPRELFPETKKELSVTVTRSAIDELEQRIDDITEFGKEYDSADIMINGSERLKLLVDRLFEYTYSLNDLAEKT